jgi:hypothetical protein
MGKAFRRFPWSTLSVDRVVRENAGHRVGIRVRNSLLWFESPDVVLDDGIEAFLAALLFPAMERGTPLRCQRPVDPVFERGLRALAGVYARWWDYRPELIGHCMPSDAHKLVEKAQVGLCFSGGVDSFYTLLATLDRVDILVFVHGFDIPLHDHRRWTAAERNFREVCAEFRKLGVIVRTNLRSHPVFKRVPWQRAHGAALAAVGHALSTTIGTLIVPPSFRADRLCPWGSDPRTDPLYSSTRLQIEHTASPAGRVDRIRQIATHASVRRHLRVCFENRLPTGNCSHCEKCLSTMCTLHGLGQLSEFEVFDQPPSLVRRLDALPRVAHHSLAVWQEVLRLQTEGEVTQAIERLLDRTGNAQRRGGLSRTWSSWWRKRSA